jgi:actin-related protein 6
LQVLGMEVERFSVPEVLFRPSDIGLRQAGLPEAILQAVQGCDVGLHAALYGNIVLTGGNVLLPGLGARLEAELRSRVPAHYAVRITTPADPVDYAWKGGALLAAGGAAVGGGRAGGGLFVTKQQYDEYGADACQERFFDVLW